MLGPLNCVFYLVTPKPDGSPGGLSFVRVGNGQVSAGGYSGDYYGNIVNQGVPGDGTASIHGHGWFYHGMAPEDQNKPKAVAAECTVTIDTSGGSMTITEESGAVLLDVAHQSLDPSSVMQGLKPLGPAAA